MKRKLIFSLLFLMVLIMFEGCNLKKDKGAVLSAEDNSPIIFFYGWTCPHCKDVEKYFEDNKIEEKIQFSKREIYRDESNLSLLKDKARICQIDEKNLGVPFLWAEGKCYIGPEQVINFFNEKIRLNDK